jgi:hypothetical protein
VSIAIPIGIRNVKCCGSGEKDFSVVPCYGILFRIAPHGSAVRRTDTRTANCVLTIRLALERIFSWNQLSFDRGLRHWGTTFLVDKEGNLDNGGSRRKGPFEDE